MFLTLMFFFLQVIQAEDTQLKKDIGSMLMIGFRGLEVSDTSKVIRDIKKYHLGSVVLFDYDVPSKTAIRNVKSPKQVKKLNADLMRLSGGNLMIAVDQEGGIIQRFKEKHGFKKFMSAAAFGDKDDANFTQRQAKLLAAELKSAGVHLNLAPVVDVNTNPKNPVIAKYDRSFSANWETVAAQAEAYIRGHKELGLGTTLKHFPGHGSSTADSHYGVVDVSDTWSDLELKPYKALIEKDIVDVVMTAHVFLKRFDKEYPATLSKNIVTGILRKQLHFEGVIISDDMNMKAISEQYGLELALEKAINAGIDLLVFGNNLGEYDPELAHKASTLIYKLVEQGKIPKERIIESSKRVKKLKEKLLSNSSDS